MSVRVECSGKVTTVIVDRPERRNAVDPAIAQALRDAFDAFETDETSNVAVLTGAGGHFCAGYDLKAFAEHGADYDPAGEGPMGPTRRLLSKPVIAAVEGRGSLRFDGRWLLASAVGLVGITGFNLFIWIGLGYTRPEHASVILALQSPLTALAVWLLRGQRPARFTLGCVAVAITGVVIVTTKGDLTNALEVDGSRVS